MAIFLFVFSPLEKIQDFEGTELGIAQGRLASTEIFNSFIEERLTGLY